MKQLELRVRLTAELLHRYQIVCVKNKLSLPKQTAAIIKDFVEIQERNLELMDNFKHGGK